MGTHTHHNQNILQKTFVEVHSIGYRPPGAGHSVVQTQGPPQFGHGRWCFPVKPCDRQSHGGIADKADIYIYI